MKLVLLKSFTYAFETTTSLAILESNNIDYYLQESTISNLFDYLGQGVNGIKLFVSIGDEPQARTLFIKANILSPNDNNQAKQNFNTVLIAAFACIAAIVLRACSVLLIYSK